MLFRKIPPATDKTENLIFAARVLQVRVFPRLYYVVPENTRAVWKLITSNQITSFTLLGVGARSESKGGSGSENSLIANNGGKHHRGARKLSLIHLPF